MKRKYESDVGVVDNRTKMFVKNDGIVLRDNNFVPTDFSPGVGRPVMASTPQGNAADVVTRRDCYPTSTACSPMSSTGHVPNPTREAELRRVIDAFVGVYEQLDKLNDVDVKPNYSYTELAFLAMLRSPNFCLPITEIYRYIQTRFVFYRNSTRKHWKNAVRHSLAKTLCFTKIPVGRGVSNSEKLSRLTFLWCIIPGSLANFARGDYRPSVDKESGTNTMRWGYYRVNAGGFWEDVGEYVATKMSAFRRLMKESHTPGLVFEAQICSLRDLPSHEHLVLQNRLSDANRATRTDSAAVYCDASDGFEKKPTPYTNNSVEKLPPRRALSRHETGQPNVERLYDTSVQCAYQPTNVFLAGNIDPWFVLPHIENSDISLCSLESERKTPPYTLHDSGFDTCDSSPEERSCRFLTSCKEENRNLTSPMFPGANVNSDFCDELLKEADALNLSSFSLNELSDIKVDLLTDQDYDKENIDFMAITEEQPCQRLSPPPMVARRACSVIPEGRFSPPFDFVPPPPPPAYSPTNFTHYQQGISTTSPTNFSYCQQWMTSTPYGRQFSRLQLQSPQDTNSTVAPFPFVVQNGGMLSAVAPNYLAPCLYN